MPKVYLAGPITGLSYGGCTEWREAAKLSLAEVGIQGFSPMRGKEYLNHLTNISGTGEEYGNLGMFSTPQGIMSRDFYDCTTCDVLLVNLLGAKTVSIGTMFEIAWAWMKRTPIVVAIEDEGNPHEHIFVRHTAGFRTNNLEEAIYATKRILIN